VAYGVQHSSHFQSAFGTSEQVNSGSRIPGNEKESGHGSKIQKSQIKSRNEMTERKAQKSILKKLYEKSHIVPFFVTTMYKCSA
jgi:hypothetical protein